MYVKPQLLRKAVIINAVKLSIEIYLLPKHNQMQQKKKRQRKTM